MTVEQQMQQMQSDYLNKKKEFNNAKKNEFISEDLNMIEDGSNINYQDKLSNIINILRNYRDLVLFSYLLEVKNYISMPYRIEPSSSVMAKSHYFSNVSVLFCEDCEGSWLTDSFSEMSCLEQCCKSELISNEYVAPLPLSIFNPEVEILKACEICPGTSVYNGETLPFCPYKLCGLIKLVAHQTKTDTKVIYERILERDLNDFLPRYNPSSIKVTDELLKDIKLVNSVSARSAMIMEEIGVFHVDEFSKDSINYSFVPLCNNISKATRINDVINFWKYRNGTSGKVILSQKEDEIQVKDDCKQCSYIQCPHKVAAYLHHIANKHLCNPYSLMKFVADENVKSSLTPSEDYQFERFKTNINKIPITENSKKQYLEMIKYIINRKKDSSIPILPFNIILHSADEKIATNIFADFFNVLNHFNYLSKNQVAKKTISLASTSFENLIEEYENTKYCTIFHIENIELLAKDDDKKYNVLMPRWIKVIESKKNIIFTFLSGDKYKLKSFFAKEPKLYNRIFSYHLFVGDMSEETVYKRIHEKLCNGYEFDEEFENSLWECVASNYLNSELKSNDYIDNLFETILFNHYSRDISSSKKLELKDLPYIVEKRSEQEIFNELDEMIGLQSIKDELRKINASAKYNQKMRRHNSKISYHMVFSGSAGTGKTTVAKLLAEILNSIGIIKQNKLVVCSGKDLIGEYMGQTAPKVAKMCEQAYNGVLFIDEAYQLNPYSTLHADGYKEEAVAELIQQMDNNRDRLIVIFAGYTKEMHDFVEHSNPGMKSRLGNIIEFPDYTLEELLEIFKFIVQKDGLELTEDALTRVSQILESAMSKTENFGNARFVRHLFERSLMKHAFRTCDLDESDNELSILDACDIDDDLRN